MRPLLEEESTARLPLARQGANLVEKYKVSPKLVQAGPRSDVADRDDQPAPLEIADGRTGLSPDEEPSRRQAAAGAIGGALLGRPRSGPEHPARRPARGRRCRQPR